MTTVLWLAVVGLALAALDRLALWMERRGWIYYRRRKPASSALGNAFLEVQALLEPEKKALLEVRHEEVREEDESGGPPDLGSPLRGSLPSGGPRDARDDVADGRARGGSR